MRAHDPTRWARILFALAIAASSPAAAECPPWTPPPGFGGPIDAALDEATAQRWLDFRSAREEERLREAWSPAAVLASYRIEASWIDEGCIPLGDLVDTGRGLFLRDFTLAEGLGNDLSHRPGTRAGDRPRPNLRRFQSGTFGGPDATRCVSCHWKGGFAGGGDRADDAFLRGDGNDITTHDERNPPALWGAGWVEIAAREMSAELRAIADALAADVRRRGGTRERPLVAKGIPFGTLSASRGDGGEIAWDPSRLEGVDTDLVVKPFGWKGTFATLREIVAASFQLHLGLEPEELLRAPGERLASLVTLGEGPDGEDPDADGVRREITEGQLTAVVAFLATLETPIVSVPTEGGWKSDPLGPGLVRSDGREFTLRWADGERAFTAIGCTGCHVPFLTVADATYRTTAPSGHALAIDLAADGAAPRPRRTADGAYVLPLFSDLKRHDMGEALAAVTNEAGVVPRHYLTRPLWGLANTSPYMHDGSAVLFDEAVALHGAGGSEAKPAADAYAALSEHEKADIRVFALSLGRKPAIRVR